MYVHPVCVVDTLHIVYDSLVLILIFAEVYQAKQEVNAAVTWSLHGILYYTILWRVWYIHVHVVLAIVDSCLHYTLTPAFEWLTWLSVVLRCGGLMLLVSWRYPCPQAPVISCASTGATPYMYKAPAFLHLASLLPWGWLLHLVETSASCIIYTPNIKFSTKNSCCFYTATATEKDVTSPVIFSACRTDKPSWTWGWG